MTELELAKGPTVIRSMPANRRPTGSAVCSANLIFAPHSVPRALPEADVAQRLIELELQGKADALTWASYKE